jgi:hypothetical protein
MVVRIFGMCLIAIMMGTSGCRSDGGSGIPAVVTVTNMNGSSLQGVTVVLGDSNGAMKTSDRTNELGEVTFFDAPANATITAALSCVVTSVSVTSVSWTVNSLDIRYDVNGPVTLRLNDCSPSSGTPPYAGAVLGTVTLNVTNTLPGVTQNTIATNRPVFQAYPALITQLTLTITPDDLQQDGKLSIYVIGQDADGESIGYGMLLDQTFVNGMTVNITVDQPMSFVQYHITNLPLTVNYLCKNLYQERTGKGGVGTMDCGRLSSSLTTTTVNVPYIPGLGDQFFFSVNAFTDQQTADSSLSSNQYLSVGPAALGDQNFDFSQALTAPNLSVAGAYTATPTLIWTGLDPAADSRRLYALFRFNPFFVGSLMINDLSASRTSIRFPELPDALAAFRPTGVMYYGIDTYDDSNGMFRMSGGTYRELQTLAAPTLNKAFLQDRQALQEQLLYQRPIFR